MQRVSNLRRSEPEGVAADRHRLIVRIAELRLENERLREDNQQLRAALSIFSEVARRNEAEKPSA